MAQKIRYRDIERFDGGFVDIVGIGIGDEALNMIRYGSNVRQRGGNVRPRGGIGTYCDFSLAPGVMGNDIIALYEYKRMQDDGGGAYSTYRAIIFTVGTDIYYVEPSVSTTVAVKMNGAVPLASADVYCANSFDHLFVGDGSSDLKVWDGNNWYNVMFAAPTADPVPVVQAGGLTGWRKYKYTFYRPVSATNPYVKESNVSGEISVDMTAGAKQCQITMETPFPDSQITQYRLYATELGADPALLVDFNSMYIGANNVYVDNNATFTGDALHNNDHGVPDTYKFLLFDGTWMFGARSDLNESVIGWSKGANPFYWNNNVDYEHVGGDDGDEITGLAMIGRVRYIFKTHSVHQWAGDPNTASEIVPVEVLDASQNMVRLAVGCADPRSIAPWANSLIFRAADGHVYQLTRESITQLSRYIPESIKMLDPDAKALIYDDYYVISSGLLTLVCDLHKGELGWQGWDTGIYPNGMLVTGDGYVLGSEDDKIIRYYNSGLSQDYGADFTKAFQPLYLNVGRGTRFAIFKSIIADTPNRGNDMSVIIYNEHGLIAAVGTLTYADTDEECFIPQGARGNYMSPRFSWDGNDSIIKVSMGIQPAKRR